MRLSNKGETIIEVLLAITVLGMVLGVSYSTASRNLRGAQDSQERTEASLIAQNIVEIIRYYDEKYQPDATPPNIIAQRLFHPNIGHSVTRQYCVNSDLVDALATGRSVEPFSANPASLCVNGSDKKGVYSARVLVRRPPYPNPALSSSLNKFDYTVIVNWQSLASGADSEAKMRYSIVRERP